jgi:hypothetical protein
MPSKNHHTPLSGVENIDSATLNAIFSDLDSAMIGASVTGTAGEALSELDMVYLASDGEWYKIDADSATPAVGHRRGVVTESGGISASGTGAIALGGIVSGFTGLTAWDLVYASTSAGGYTQTRPSVTDGGGQVAIVEMGLAVSTTQVYVSPAPIIYAERETLADNATLTIVHPSDVATRKRRVRAYVSPSYDEGLMIGSVSGDVEEIGVRFDDGSGSDADTKTTFKNLTGASADIICIVEVV